MSKIKPLWIVIGVVVLILLWVMGAYNGLVNAKETVSQSWGDVQAQYQRRLDLIPNLVSTVEGAVKFEQTTQTQIAALRTGVANAKTALANAQTGDERVAAVRQADQVSDTFTNLNINVENYPQLKATENFLSLQDELAGTENRVAVARQRYNEATRNYNVKTKRFPSNIIAGMFGFTEEKFFEADEGAAEAPKVEF